MSSENEVTPFDPSGPPQHGAGVFGLPAKPEAAQVHLIPVPWEATASYGDGTARAPRAIKKASLQLDLFDADLGKPYEHGIVMLKESAAIRKLNAENRPRAKKIIKVGGVSPRSRSLAAVNRASKKVNELVQRAAARSLDKGKIVGVVGGDHSSPLGLIAELASRHPGMGVLHIDAHHDLRVAYEGFEFSHASIMHHVAALPKIGRMVQVGVRDYCEQESLRVDASQRRIVVHRDADIRRALFGGVQFKDIIANIVDALPESVYVSFDIDGLDPKLCPGTGTPVPGGLDFAEASELLLSLVRSGRRVVGFDLCEVAPGKTEWDASVGARVLYKLIGAAVFS